MKWLDMLDGEPQPSATTHHLLGEGNIDQALQAPAAGYFKSDVALLDDIHKGQRLGTIRDLFGEVIAELHADTDGVIIMLRRFHRVRVGDGLAHITKQYSK